MKQIAYLTTEKIIELNILALSIFKVKKADKPHVLSYKKIEDITNGCIQVKGDVYDKATFFLKEIVRKHPFASGNHRTAVIAAKAFIQANKAVFSPKDDSSQVTVLMGIREDYYSDQEIKEWIQPDKIREFRR